MPGPTPQPPSARRERPLFTLRLLTAANAALYVAASILHLGVRIPLGFVTLGFPEPILPATVVEGLIGAGLAAAGVALFVSLHSARRLAWGAYVFALIGTLFGLTVVLLRRLEGPDTWIHFVMLAGLAGGLIILFGTRRSRGG